MSKQATKHHSHGVNAWVNAQGFATWQILFSQSPKQHENFVMF
jgi:hypothetical protein